MATPRSRDNNAVYIGPGDSFGSGGSVMAARAIQAHSVGYMDAFLRHRTAQRVQQAAYNKVHTPSPPRVLRPSPKRDARSVVPSVCASTAESTTGTPERTSTDDFEFHARVDKLINRVKQRRQQAKPRRTGGRVLVASAATAPPAVSYGQATAHTRAMRASAGSGLRPRRSPQRCVDAGTSPGTTGGADVAQPPPRRGNEVPTHVPTHTPSQGYSMRYAISKAYSQQLSPLR